MSARHAHLSAPTLAALFGPGAVLKVHQPLAQPGQFAAEEKWDEVHRTAKASLQLESSVEALRLFVEAEGIEIPMDFHPDEADEIAEGIRAAARAALSVKR